MFNKVSAILAILCISISAYAQTSESPAETEEIKGAETISGTGDQSEGSETVEPAEPKNDETLTDENQEQTQITETGESQEQTAKQEKVAGEEQEPPEAQEQIETMINGNGEIEKILTEETATPPESVTAPDCLERCEEACSCRKKLGGGGFFVMVLFNSHDTKYGNFNGPSLFFGGRGFGYFGEDNEWRLGAMGAGGWGTDDSKTAIGGSLAGLYPFSEERSVSGGYGGFTAEYVLRAGGVVEFPIGFLLGGGGGSFESELLQSGSNVSGIKHSYSKDSGFLALQPMIGVEANITSFMRAAIAVSYLLAEPFSNDRYISGFSILFGIDFGQFEEMPISL